jgi:sialate O-acetylesterase
LSKPGGFLRKSGMLKTYSRWILPVLLVMPLSAEIILAPLFQSGGVLQREKSVPVWGRATPGKSVTVTFAGQSKSATADTSGRWQISLDAMPASPEGRTMSVTEAGLAPVLVTDLLVGEVWLGSGQSNMQWTIAQSRKEDQAIAAQGPVPLLRLFQVPRSLNHIRQETVEAKWTPATPKTAIQFSAVGYFFGKELAENLQIPVGIIHSSWGGSRIEPWWAEEGLAGIDPLAATREERLAKSPGFPQYDKPYRQFVSAVRQWAEQAESSLDAGLPTTAMPKEPERLTLGHNAQAGTYQAMIHPLVPYALRGFLWYQGESNNGEGMLYTQKKQALIAGWRKQFLAPEAPFLFVQLAPYNYGANRTLDLPGIWWAQQATLKIPNTGMAVTNDIGNPKDIHPGNKSEVARRLSLWALADTYGNQNIVKSGPLFKKYQILEGAVSIQFDHTGGGLKTLDEKSPDWFEIAAADGVFHQAEAKISADGKTILLTSSAVPNPDRARFAWSQIAEPNLRNAEGLPAAAFHTHWPVDPTRGKIISKGKPHVSSDPNVSQWNSGLTDGVWGTTAGTCFATGNAPGFPKFVTLDLGEIEHIHLVAYGTPNIGATKTVAISISEDGTNFKEVGRSDFPPKKAKTVEARFTPQPARFIRATFVANHRAQDSFDANFGFLSELEVFAP